MTKPILFNTDMVRAILDNRKTVTRRVVKPLPRKIYHDGKLYEEDGDSFALAEDQNGQCFQIVPPYRPGDILYVRETWRSISAWSGSYTGCRIEYKTGGVQIFDEIIALPTQKGEWRPSIHMPCKAARIFLRVTDVRVERLQEITELDILEKEGVTVDLPQPQPSYMSFAYTETRLKPAVRKAFSDLWNSTIKPAAISLYGWNANPWVWVIEFERIRDEVKE